MKRRVRNSTSVGFIVAIAAMSSLFTLLLSLSMAVGLLQGSDVFSQLLDEQTRRIAAVVRIEVENRTADSQDSRQPEPLTPLQKSSIAGSVAFKEGLEAVAPASELPNIEEESSAEEQQDDGLQPASAILPEGVSSLLRKGRSGLTIGNFHSSTIDGAPEECVDLGYSMLADVGASNDFLDILVASDQITISKICATNGSIIFTCRAGKLTISPRRKKPNDGCTQA